MTHQFNFQIYPQYLSVEEMANPFMIITAFYLDYDLPEAKTYIYSWMNFAHKAKSWNNESPDNILCFYENILKLIESVWLIQQLDNSGRQAKLSLSKDLEETQLMNVDFYCKPFHKKYPWLYFPRSLSQKEYINPYKVFPKFFRFHTLSEWKQQLHKALHRSLTATEVMDTKEMLDVLNIKKHLDKLTDACHLIDVRELQLL